MTSHMLLPMLAANAVAVVFFVFTLYRPNGARMVAGAGVILSGLVNATLALLDPQIYVNGLGPNAIGVYKTLITGLPVHGLGRLIVGIGLWQLVVGALILTNIREYVRLGCFAACFFLLGISPLGPGCAFPSNLILAAGMVALFFVKWPRQAEAPVTKAGAKM